ncbi:YncE family protein [Pseudonocardia alni]|uniref:DNA-binding beta-propeller fold protein YncE n=1 Tax=Pseudonocardia alni TaxID=33907 RepID=A0A852W788_PSEA5|nr:YncE family protein [Pseudonocardia antarctica]NYG05007.1 DNA-binding beta-propeller fold protein YncE [Pseudonocardia antarctica]
MATVGRTTRATLIAPVALVLLAVGCAAPPADTPAAPGRAGTPVRFAEPLPPPAEPGVAPPVVGTPPGRVVAVGATPEGIVAGGPTRRVTVGVRQPDGLALLDADTAAVVGRVPLPGVLRHLQLAAPGGPVLVPSESANGLLRVALPEGRVTSQVMTGAMAHDATETAAGTVFVANEAGGSVSVVRDEQVVRRLTDVTQPAGLAPMGDRVGLIDVRENTLTVYDAATGDGVRELPAGDGPTHLVADRHGRMIATDTRGGRLIVFDPAGAPAEVGRVDLTGEPYGIAYDPVRDRLWVTATGANLLVGYDMTDPTPREVARIPTVRQPNTVAVDPDTGRLFVTGTADGVVQVVDGPIP